MFFSVPGDPPQDVFVVVSSPITMLVEWNPPLTPNGVITHYTIYLQKTAALNVTGDRQSFLVERLSPNTMFNVSVSASTKAGEGPASDEEFVMTPESSELIIISPLFSHHSPRPFITPSSRCSAEYDSRGIVRELNSCVLGATSLS